MPYIIDEDITFTFVIDKTANVIANLDIVKVDPDGITTFDEAGTTHGAVYTPPTPDGLTDGSFVFTTNFDKPGRWLIGIADGIDVDYLIIAQSRISIEEHTPYVDSVIIFPDPVSIPGYP